VFNYGFFNSIFFQDDSRAFPFLPDPIRFQVHLNGYQESHLRDRELALLVIFWNRPDFQKAKTENRRNSFLKKKKTRK
jgi:hypothetical protein